MIIFITMKLDDLYTKVSEFQSSQGEDFKEKLHCKKGCDLCCYTDLSIFEIEANNIRDWLLSLRDQEKKTFKQALKMEQEEKTDFNGNLASPCCFLKNGACLIYQVRPLICRTQGNAFFIKDRENYLDICPLNEDALKEIKQNDILNLELLNTILVQLNKYHGFSEQRVSLKELLRVLIQDEKV